MTKKELRRKVALISTLLQLKNKPIAYVSGKVTGLPIDEVKKKFHDMQVKLESAGYAVFNPVQRIDSDCDWNTAMRICIAILPLCDSIHMLNDWEASKGACEEIRVAHALEIPIRYWWEKSETN